MMGEPVICPSCGASFGDYPAGGKCAKCGGVIASPTGRSPAGIDDEIARLGGPAKTCPTCGKPLPVGRKTCPDCRKVQAEPEHHGWPAWVVLLVVLVFAAVGTYVAVKWAKGKGSASRKDFLERTMTKVDELAGAWRIGDAVIELNSARKQLEWFDEMDAMRSDFAGRIERKRKDLRQKADARIQELLSKGDYSEAERFYNDEAMPLDLDKSMRTRIDESLANRKALQAYRGMRDQAKKLYADGKFAEALQQLADLRTQIADPRRARGEEAAAIRVEVEGLFKGWVREANDKAWALFNDGKLAAASGWFEALRPHVQDREQLRRIEDVISNIASKRVVGVVVNVAAARIVKNEEAGADVMKRLRLKLEDVGVLVLTLSSRTDAKAAELTRVLVADYREDRSGTFTSETRQRATGTKITCTLKVVSPSDNRVVWQEKDPVIGTTSTGGVRMGDFNDANLRLDAQRNFFLALDAVRIAGRDVIP